MITEEKNKKNEFKLDVEEMSRAGLHFGHRTFRINPKMKPYIFGVRNGVHIIDLEKTKEKLEEALKFIQNLIVENKTLLLVGTKVQAGDTVKEIAKECGLFYVSERWLGGTFTNFDTILKRLQSFKDLETNKAEGALEKYTKKERAKFDQKLKDFEIKFGGIKNMQKLPDAIFVLDMKKDALALKEARAKGVKIIAIAHTNVDPTLADYPVPANDDSASSLKYILEKTKEAILKVRSKV
ncbi:MAG: 30S ribosomal protein S2 [Parcubacteria group bacterium]